VGGGGRVFGAETFPLPLFLTHFVQGLLAQAS